MTTRDSEPGDALDQILTPGPRHSMLCDFYHPSDIYQHEPPPCSCGMSDLWNTGKAELAALRQRAEDLELLLRFEFIGEGEGWNVAEFVEGGRVLSWVTMRGPELIAQDDGTGLPILTDQARAALRVAINTTNENTKGKTE